MHSCLFSPLDDWFFSGKNETREGQDIFSPSYRGRRSSLSFLSRCTAGLEDILRRGGPRDPPRHFNRVRSAPADVLRYRARGSRCTHREMGNTELVTLELSGLFAPANGRGECSGKQSEIECRLKFVHRRFVHPFHALDREECPWRTVQVPSCPSSTMTCASEPVLSYTAFDGRLETVRRGLLLRLGSCLCLLDLTPPPPPPIN